MFQIRVRARLSVVIEATAPSEVKIFGQNFKLSISRIDTDLSGSFLTLTARGLQSMDEAEQLGASLIFRLQMVGFRMNFGTEFRDEYYRFQQLPGPNTLPSDNPLSMLRPLIVHVGIGLIVMPDEPFSVISAPSGFISVSYSAERLAS